MMKTAAGAGATLARAALFSLERRHQPEKHSYESPADTSADRLQHTSRQRSLRRNRDNWETTRPASERERELQHLLQLSLKSTRRPFPPVLSITAARSHWPMLFSPYSSRSVQWPIRCESSLGLSAPIRDRPATAR